MNNTGAVGLIRWVIMTHPDGRILLSRSVFEERLPWPDPSLNTYYTSARKFEATGDLKQAEKLYALLSKKLDELAQQNKVCILPEIGMYMPHH
jgi:hypothetical protein